MTTLAYVVSGMRRGLILCGALLVAGALCSTSCVHNKTRAYFVLDETQKEREDNATGIRYYGTAPHIVVYSQAGSYKSELMHLPDTSIVYSTSPENLLASNQLTMKLKDGVLLDSESVVDATKFPSALIDAAKAVALANVGAASAATASGDEASDSAGEESLNLQFFERKPPPPHLPRIYVFRLAFHAGAPVLYSDSERIPIDWSASL